MHTVEPMSIDAHTQVIKNILSSGKLSTHFVG